MADPVLPLAERRRLEKIVQKTIERKFPTEKIEGYPVTQLVSMILADLEGLRAQVAELAPSSSIAVDAETFTKLFQAFPVTHSTLGSDHAEWTFANTFILRHDFTADNWLLSLV